MDVKSYIVYIAGAPHELSIANLSLACVKNGWTTEDLRKEDSKLLLFLCAINRKDMIEWLVGEFGLTSQDIRSGENYMLGISVSMGYLDLAKWLTSTFGLTGKDARECYNLALELGILFGRRETVEWFVDTFKVTVDDIRSIRTSTVPKSYEYDENAGILRDAISGGHVEFVKWLVEKFDLYKDVAHIEKFSDTGPEYYCNKSVKTYVYYTAMQEFVEKKNKRCKH